MRVCDNEAFCTIDNLAAAVDTSVYMYTFGGVAKEQAASIRL